MIPLTLLKLDSASHQLYLCMIDIFPLPFDIIELILNYLLVNKVKVFIKENYYKPYDLPFDNDCIKLYTYLLRFAKEFKMTPDEFDRWFSSGLKIGFSYKSDTIIIYRLPNGETKEQNEVSCIINYFDYRDNIINVEENIIQLQIKHPRYFPVYHYEPVVNFIKRLNTKLNYKRLDI